MIYCNYFQLVACQGRSISFGKKKMRGMEVVEGVQDQDIHKVVPNPVIDSRH